MQRPENLEKPEEALLRYVDENRWEWRTVVKVMNRTYNGNYTIAELKEIYTATKNYGTYMPLINNSFKL